MSAVWVDGVPTPELGAGVVKRLCVDCGASWCGMPDDGCDWCARASDRQRADQRRLLLFPAWLHSDVGSPRYDELSEIDRAVWDRTRGQARDTGSLAAWGEQLGRAVKAGLISDDEAQAAIERSER